MVSSQFAESTEAGQERIQTSGFVIAVGACVLFSICFAISCSSSSELPCGFELDGRINPNNAPVASLVRLPGIGLGRAEAIAAYRTDFAEQGKDCLAFQGCDDLQKVKGIGPKTVQNISQWLKFE